MERRALLEQHAHRRPPTPEGPATGWVHGDFHPLNLLYRGADPVAIVDWDRLDVQPRAEEAVRAAAIFFVRPAGELDLAKVRAYARAYRRAAGAGAGELAAAVHRVWWERLNDFWILRWRYRLDDREGRPAVSRGVGPGGVVDARVRGGVRGLHGVTQLVVAPSDASPGVVPEPPSSPPAPPSSPDPPGVPGSVVGSVGSPVGSPVPPSLVLPSDAPPSVSVGVGEGLNVGSLGVGSGVNGGGFGCVWPPLVVSGSSGSSLSPRSARPRARPRTG